MKRITTLALLLVVFSAPAHAQKTKAAISSEITTLFPDNSLGLITPSQLRTVTSDIINSIMPTAPVVTGNLACFNGTTGLLQDCGLSPSGVGLTVGASTVASGTDKAIMYQNGASPTGTLGEITPAANSVLVTNGSNTPSLSTTLPSGLAATSMTLTTPSLGVATATSINKMAITAPATSSTLAVADGKTATISNTLTLTSTDGATLAVGGGGTLGSNAYTSTAFAPLASPTFTGVVTFPTPWTLGATSVTSTGTQLNYLNAATGTTGTASTNIVFSAGPTMTGTTTVATLAATTINGAALSGTFTGNPTLSGNATFSGQLIETGTSAPASAAGNTVVMGTIAAPSLANNGQAFLYNTLVNGGILQGQGSTYDAVVANKSGTVAMGVSTGLPDVVFGGKITAASLATPSANIAGALCATAGGSFLYNVGANCYAGGGTAGGSNTQVQYNASGGLAGITGVTSNGTIMTFAANDLVINGGSATAGLATVTSGGVVSSAASATIAQMAPLYAQYQYSNLGGI